MSITSKISAAFAAAALSLSMSPTSAYAAGHTQNCQTDNKAFVLFDIENGQVLMSDSDDIVIQPASLAKMMTLVVIFDAIEQGLIEWEGTLTVSENSRESGEEFNGVISKDLLGRDIERIRIDRAISLIAIRSFNDLTIALAKDVAVAYGSEKPNEEQEQDFVNLMNIKAQELNMKDTVFTNSTGLPSDLSQTTVTDMAKLLKYIHDERPEIEHIMGQDYIYYAGERYEHTNTLERAEAFQEYNVTGKTGYVGKTCRVWAVSLSDGEDVNLGLVSVGHKNTWARHYESIELFERAIELNGDAAVYSEDGELKKIEWEVSEPEEVSVQYDPYNIF